MPGFVKTPKDEAKWSKAKAAAKKSKKKDESSFTDQDWALVNYIYHQMGKSVEFAKHISDPSYIDEMMDMLEKARKKLSDEYDPNEDPTEDESDTDEGFHEIDPDAEGSEGEDWLKENDPQYQEYAPDEDEDQHQAAIADNDEDEETAAIPAAENVPQKRTSRFEQPSREDLMAMRAYTRPWEQRAREAQALKADPSKNPELARHGNIVEARNTAHADRNAAYREFTNSANYKNADPVTQMEMDDQFEHNWKQQNPEHLKNALTAHHEAHEKGKGARDIHAASKDAQIRNILAGGGHGGEGYSLEEGMQHAGGSKGEEGTQATVVQDPASSFAMGNQDFINQYAKDYANKGKKVSNIDDMHNYDEGSKRDINRILGEGPTKDPKFEKFFSHYHPLIGMNAHKTLHRLGIDPKHPDVDMSMLHEAGMHGLIQAMNDYEHDNPGKASFATHAANKIRGLQMTAMKNQDAIPTELRQAQKKFASQKPKVDVHKVLSGIGHPEATNAADRFKRLEPARASHQAVQQRNAVKIRKAPQGGGTPTGGGT